MSDSTHRLGDPRILLLPFAVDEPLGALAVEEGVLARRLPDFLHLVLNGGAPSGPAGMLEIQSVPQDGSTRWVVLESPPDPSDVLSMLGDTGPLQALITGSIRRHGTSLAIDLSVHSPGSGDGRRRPERDGPEGEGTGREGIEHVDLEAPSFDVPEFDASSFDLPNFDAANFDAPDLGLPEAGASGFEESSDADFGPGSSGDFESFEPDRSDVGGVPRSVHGVVHLAEPVPGLLRIAEHLAAMLQLPQRRPDARLLTTDARAFFRFLQGLDGAALLGGDPSLERERRGVGLVTPLVDAVDLDPGFGLALRTVAHSLAAALDDERVPDADCLAVLDRCLASQPADSEGCVAIAEHLTMIGETSRASRWLDHAVGLEPAAPRALESLGVLLANRGDTEQARDLWRRGAESDGSPDFHAHLARLAFADGDEHAAWRSVEVGLRGTWERVARPDEWPDEPDSPSVLLRYLADHLERGDWPVRIEPLVRGLAGLLIEPQTHIDLGICLARLGYPDEALPELHVGLAGDAGPEAADRGMRMLLVLEIPGFEKRFALASELAVHGKDPQAALHDLQAFLEHRADFWPAMFYAGMAMKRLGQEDAALDVMAEVLQRRPGQVDALQESAELFAVRGNPKRALEFINEAVAGHPDLADLHLRRARFLEQLGRDAEAAAALDHAVELDHRSSASGSRRRGSLDAGFRARGPGRP